MKKVLCLLSCLSIIATVAADETDMAEDILAQIVHGPVNADPDLNETVADQTVIVSLRASAITLACKQQYPKESAVTESCIKRNKIAVLTIGELSEPAFAVGKQAAEQQAKIHREVKLKGYTTVINQLLGYIKNLVHKSGA